MEAANHANKANEGFDAEIVRLLVAEQLPLSAYIRSLLPGDPAAGDVLQATCMRIWEKRQEFCLGTNFRAWAFAIARFEVLNHRKQQARDRQLYFSEELEELVTEEMQQHGAVESGHLEALHRCLQKLRPRQRELLMQRYSGQWTIAQMAQQVGRSADGMRVTLHRLRSLVAQCLRREADQGDVVP
ncbi:MAG: DNA-directed RNA polymerase sigma-70 factor [Pirellulaceae bacterium]|nr:MAG: DNA-directed RNA polymerase sigma-70 factor [Pirellulaceae bacterium]